MTLIKYKPTSPGIRHMVRLKNKELYKGRPIKRLTKILNKTGGRNNKGRITTRHIGGRHKRFYRIIDFKRIDTNGIVSRFEYDPNRSSNIALIVNNNIKKYILLPKGLKIGDKIESNGTSTSVGSSLLIRDIPVGSKIHNIEFNPGKGGKISRSAGCYSSLISKSKKYAILRLKSGEIRNINLNCRATIGEVGNSEKVLISLGKAGSNRWKGVRPTVRGTAMNPIDHPHGGGEGKNFGKHPVTPWGKYTKGKKTRNNKLTDKLIIKARNK
ncbi:50S ribosomal protein L2 [endosymbiont of Pachyrhynchus infernalis]|uniref:50S ribosomal protein L2 n=1 Tax=endosymbiont of Pachyrhynchus infernalis TaxID=1971488 RepID=UPI000DC73A09|nr:50S ribosomal protein L2 [endosymbiont of Pachyrhynchus infernalis]BBA84835.1 50S ribosomal protein L2 [endosymbiont of Pachyrhynchus infernalis]